MMGCSTGAGLLQHRIGADGTPLGRVVAAPDLMPSVVLTSSASGLVYGARADGSIGLFTIDFAGRLQAGHAARDTDVTYLERPVALATLAAHGGEYLAVLSGAEAGVSVFSIDPQDGGCRRAARWARATGWHPQCAGRVEDRADRRALGSISAMTAVV